LDRARPPRALPRSIRGHCCMPQRPRATGRRTGG